MLTLQTNFTKLQAVAQQLRLLTEGEAGNAFIAATLPETVRSMQQRIHQHGLAADDTAFSTHPSRKGFLVNSGRLRNELSVLPPTGIGWRDASLTARANNLQQRYNKSIWQLSSVEKAAMRLRLGQQITRLLQQP